MFSVRWKPSARQDLARIWLQASSDSRKAITKASHRIDTELSQAPETKGESRDKNRRIFLVAPLGVILKINDKTTEVNVLQVWYYD